MRGSFCLLDKRSLDPYSIVRMKRPSLMPAVYGFAALLVVLFGVLLIQRNRQLTPVPGPVLVETIDRGMSVELQDQFATKISAQLALIADTEAKGPRDVTQYLQLGNFYYTIGDLVRARDAYQVILLQIPQDAPALQNIGQVYFEMGDLASAENAWRQSLVVELSEDYFLRLVRLIELAGPVRNTDIKLVLETAVANLGQTYNLMYELARWHELDGQYAWAQSYYEVAQQLLGDGSLTEKIEEMRRKSLE